MIIHEPEQSIRSKELLCYLLPLKLFSYWHWKILYSYDGLFGSDWTLRGYWMVKCHYSFA